MDDFKVNVRNKIRYARNRFAGPIRVLKSFLVEFCDNSNIHGVRYFTERTLHWSERIWWLIAISISIWMCVSLSHSIWDDWNKRPVKLSFTERQEPVTIIPFPQVTICHENGLYKEEFDVNEASKSLVNLSDIQKVQLSAMVHICPLLQRKQLEFEDDFASESIYEQIEYYSQITDYAKCHGTCDTVPILTDEGLCLTYNALNSSTFYTDEMASGMKKVNINSKISVPNWHFETPFNYTWDENRYPIHNLMHGRLNGELFYLFFLMDKIQTCDPRGLKVALSNPGETVKISQNYIHISPSEITYIIIKPKLTYTADELRSYDPSQRQCYFNSERQLRFFRIYSQSSCDAECLANFTKIECGCVKFTMPRDNKTRICGGAKIECYNSAEQKLKSDSEVSFREQCNCLPSCTTVEYNAEIERSRLDSDSMVPEKNAIELGSLWIYYGDMYMTTVKRVPVYSYLDFLANCGGFLGVCLGASTLSIIELIYFASLRLYWANQTPKSSKIFTSIDRYLSELRLVRGTRWFFNELCDNSNIHGFFYFTRRKLHWSERLFWLISVGASIWMSYSLIYDFWLQWNANLVTLNLSKSPASISTISLPTITICWDVKSMSHRLNGTPIATTQFQYLVSKMEFRTVLQTIPIVDLSEGLKQISAGGNESEAIYDAIQTISPQINETMGNCWWNNEPFDCTKFFVPVLTEEGLCFSFNALNSNEIYTDEMASGMKIVENNPKVNNWTIENGYTNEPSESDFPMRLFDSAEGATFKIYFAMVYDEIDSYYRMLGSDFKVIFTTPGDAIRFSNKFYQLQLSRDVRLTVQPKKTIISAGLRSYTPNQRQCFLESERRLKFFKIYTQSNCELECLANHLIEKFGCVKFHYPRNANTSICGVYIKPIVTTAENEFWSDGRVLAAKGQESVREKCNCLPTCTTIVYNVVADKTYLVENRINSEEKNGRHIEKAELTITFENSVEIGERIETYTFAEFLAICGGLLGLFMGISALSIIELIYFCTLRWFWKLRRERADNGIDAPQTRVIDVIPHEE